MTTPFNPRVLLAALAWAGCATAAPVTPKARPAAPTTVTAVLARAGVADDDTELRDLVAQPAAADNDFARRRAAIRACHAERYATARDNVLAGRAAPLRPC